MKESKSFSNHPFRLQSNVLAKVKKDIRRQKKKKKAKQLKKKAAPQQPSLELSEEDWFAKAMSDVQPISASKHAVFEASHIAKTFPSEEELVLRELEALVDGTADFSLYYSDEYVEGSIEGVDPVFIEKLRKGDYAWQGYIDLHGMSLQEAKDAVRSFVSKHQRAGSRCILIVHGRGLHSIEKVPVLKQNLIRWLTRGFLRKDVLAFATARNHDGGPGALYVILQSQT